MLRTEGSFTLGSLIVMIVFILVHETSCAIYQKNTSVKPDSKNHTTIAHQTTTFPKDSASDVTTRKGANYTLAAVQPKTTSGSPQKNQTTARATTQINNPTTSTTENRRSNDELSALKGDLVGWRRVDPREFPYVVSLMHQKYRVHICTGVMLTSTVVMSYIRCVVRRKSVADKVTYRLAETEQIIIGAGMASSKFKGESVLRNVTVIITAYPNPFKGKLVFLLLEQPVPYSIYHRPVKMYSMFPHVLKDKLQEFVGETFCEVVTWEDTVICLNATVKKPKSLKAYKIKILESKTCMEQDFRLGVRAHGEWTTKKDYRHCFVGMGGRKCGSAPGGPVVCGNAVYGIMSLGTSCSEFGDYTFFIPVNNTEIYYLYKRTIEVELELELRAAKSQSSTAISPVWLLIILTTCICTYRGTKLI